MSEVSSVSSGYRHGGRGPEPGRHRKTAAKWLQDETSERLCCYWRKKSPERYGDKRFDFPLSQSQSLMTSPSSSPGSAAAAAGCVSGLRTLSHKDKKDFLKENFQTTGKQRLFLLPDINEVAGLSPTSDPGLWFSVHSG